jgi:hypothetical protein
VENKLRKRGDIMGFRGKAKSTSHERRIDTILVELGYSQEDMCDEPRTTNGVLVIPVKSTKELPDMSRVVEENNDNDATLFFKRFEVPPPEKIFRHGHLYYMDTPDLFKNPEKS